MPAALLGGVFGFLVSGVVCLLLGMSFVLTPVALTVALAMGVFQVGAGMILYTLGAKAIPAAELALLAMTEVLLGPVWVWLFLGEGASLSTLLGGAVLLAALAGNAVSGLRQRP